MVRARVNGWVIHDVCESPHRYRSTKMCSCVRDGVHVSECVCFTAACFVFIWFHSHLTASLFFLSLFQLQHGSSESNRTTALTHEYFGQREIVVRV